MTVVLVATAAILAAIIGLALILPCAACRKRRKRLEAAYREWQRQRTPS
jgi:hypothetical protein